MDLKILNGLLSKIICAILSAPYFFLRHSYLNILNCCNIILVLEVNLIYTYIIYHVGKNESFCKSASQNFDSS